MKLLIVTAVIAALASTPAHARKDCTELKQEIASRIDAKGVPHYSLEIIPCDADSPAKKVGSCDGGTQQIVYTRLPPPAAEPALVASEKK